MVILNFLDQNTMSDVTREAIWVVSNCIEAFTQEERIDMIRKHNIIYYYTNLLKESKTHPKTCKIVLLSLGKLLDTYSFFPENSTEEPRLAFETNGGIEICEDLQLVPNVEIFSLSQNLLKKYFPDGEEQQLSKIEDMEDDGRLDF